MAVTSVASAASDTQLLATDTGREGFIVTNTDTNDLYVLLDSATSSASNFSVVLATNESFSVTGYEGEIRGIWAADGAGAALVTDW